MEIKKKRDYKYFSVFAIIVISGLVAGIFSTILGKDSDSSAIIGAIIGTFADYIICAGLVNNRMGSLGEYFSYIKTINLKVILINIIISIILAFVEIFAGFGIALRAGIDSVTSEFSNLTGSQITFVIVFLIINLLLSLVIAYLNFVLSDNRFRNIGILDSIKKIFDIGFKLFIKTFILSFKYYGAVVILSILLVLGVLVGNELFIMISFAFLMLALIVLFFMLPSYIARLSDLYLDYVEENYPIDSEIEGEII